MKFKWSLFSENTSTHEALHSFAEGKLNYRQFCDACHPTNCKLEIIKMSNSKIKISEVRSRAKKASARCCR